MDEVIGELVTVVFHNEDNLYSVIKVKVRDQDEKKYLTVTGNFPIPDEDSEYKYKGNYFNHPRFGIQFVVDEYEKIMPSDRDSVIKYLSSSLFPKIGVKTASKIYDAIGENTIEKIKNDNSLLDELISEESKKIILLGINSGSYFDDAVRMFVPKGLSLKMLLKIQSVYKDKMIDVILDNPYSLVDDVYGIGFKTADEFALNIGVKKDDLRRIKACLVYCTKEVCFNYSDTYTNEETIFAEFDKIIANIDMKSKKYYLDILISEGKLYREDDRIFPMEQFAAEKENARILSKFIKKIINDISHDELAKAIDTIENRVGIKYDEYQKEAIFNCINSGVSIITGGPGTGKTTIVNAIVQLYKTLVKDNCIYICAPTGRASKRLTEITDVKATTIHSLLKWDLHSNTFSVNESNPLYGNLLIVDEFSMVDNYLLYKLLIASENIGQIIFIGDDDQLPSVGPGNVLKDLIDIGLVNTIRLNKIYRQSEQSNIIKLAHHIKNNESIDNDFENDVIFYRCSDYDIKRNILNYVKVGLSNGYEYNDIQILAPMYQGVNGIDNFNVSLQEYFNPSDDFKKEVRCGKVIFRENDKILQLKNQNEDNVFNGDIGNIVEIENNSGVSNSKIVVCYDDNYVEYTYKDFINITHAYCISVHKSQGSEYPLVILAISSTYSRMLARNLIYTAITRAKKKLVIVGNYEAFLQGIGNTKYRTRKTTLKEKLIKCVNPI